MAMHTATWYTQDGRGSSKGQKFETGKDWMMAEHSIMWKTAFFTVIIYCICLTSGVGGPLSEVIASECPVSP